MSGQGSSASFRLPPGPIRAHRRARNLPQPVRQWRHMTLDGPKDPPRKKDEDREIEYVMCGQCGTPCYVFETEGSRITEATCLVCGNDEVRLFNLGEEAGPDDD
jgi:hypothetical protein